MSKAKSGWYCPRFGVREKQKVLVTRVTAQLPASLVCCIGNVPDGALDVDRSAGKLTVGDRVYRFPVE